MPNVYIDNSQRWLELSEIDYLGHFVRAWLAFNAWYRNAYTHTRDRAIIDELKWKPNVLRNRLVPLIETSSEDGDQLRSYIGSLHYRLENYHLHSGRDDEKERISLKNFYLKTNLNLDQSGRKNNIEYRIRCTNNPKQINCIVIRQNGTTIFSFTQQKYDPN